MSQAEAMSARDWMRKSLDRCPRALALLKHLWHLKKVLFRRSEGERILRANFRKVHGRELDLANPRTFSEKLYRRMILLNRTASRRYTALADKYLVRSYVAEKVGERYLTNIHWHGTDPREIPFERLPRKYVLKTNHGSAQVILVDGAVDKEAAVSKLQNWLRTNYYWAEREYQYFDIEPRVLAEEFLDDTTEGGPLDYRFWCFNGTPAVIQVDNHRHDINPFFDVDWNPLDLCYRQGHRPASIARPANLDEMLRVAAALSAEFDFVRVDMYNLGGRICIGELTFTPVAGQLKFRPERWDLELGQKWVLR